MQDRSYTRNSKQLCTEIESWQMMMVHSFVF